FRALGAGGRPAQPGAVAGPGTASGHRGLPGPGGGPGRPTERERSLGAGGSRSTASRGAAAVSADVRVTKMSGAGNDFVVLDAETAGAIPDLPAWARRVCRRGLSVGADGVLVVGPEDGGVRVLFLNPDGGEAFCGNGTRCAARFAVMRGFGKGTLHLRTAAGDVEAHVEGARVRLELPGPRDL